MQEVAHDFNLLWYLGIYGVLMVSIGIFYSRKIETSEDFILAGKGLGAVVLMGTLMATWMGSGTVTGGQNSMAYSFGIWPAMLYSIASPIGILILYLISAKIRNYGKYTISGILEDKYGKEARVLSSLIIVLAYVGIVSYQLTGLGFVLNVTTGISVTVGTIIALFLTVFLATIGGLKSVAPTDALSSFVILIGLILGIPAVINTAGGWSEIINTVPESNLTITGGLTPLQLSGYLLPGLFLLLGDQNMYQRLSSSKGERESKIGSLGWLIGILVMGPGVAIIAFSARAIFPSIDPGMAFIATTTAVPRFIGGILLASATGFIITTGNSYLLSAATSFTYDFYDEFINPDASDKKKLMITKITIPILGLISYVLIRYFPTILDVQMYAYTVYAAGITPAVLAVFLWDRVNRAGGLSSMISGVIITLVWEILLKKPYDINSVVVAVPVAVIILIVVTLITTKPKAQETTKTEAKEA